MIIWKIIIVYLIHNHNYFGNAGWYISDYLKEIVKHTAGSIVYSLKKKIICEIWRDILEGSDSVKSKLTILKNNF